MAAKKWSEKTAWEKRHQLDLATIDRRINAIYDAAIKEAARLGVSLDVTDTERLFSFADYPDTEKQVQKLLETLKERLQVAIINGVQSSWTLANKKNDELCNHVFGPMKGKMPESMERRYYSTNEAARDAFIGRKVNGLGLSDRVWRYTEQFKTEIELGLDCGIRDGQSAAGMARELKQYLKYPDKLFRRVRNERGQLVLSRAARDFHPGRGVYRSSYKNARRLAATETNIAYRTADHERWKELDFVVGIEIRLSSNHTYRDSTGKLRPLTDICDKLAGRYPKDFKFTGWHPHCRCYAVSILKTTEEIMEDNKRILRGEKPSETSVNDVRDVPDAFKEWLLENGERISKARSLPYFLRDNGVRNEDGVFELHEFGAAEERPLTILERAAIRHRERTPEQAEAIMREYRERKAIRGYGDRILRYMDGVADIDTTALREALRGGDVSLIESEAYKLKALGKEILALDRLADPMSVARSTSMAMAKTINAAVNRTLSGMPTDLDARKAKLEFEIDWVGKDGKRRYPDTYIHSQDAYRKELAFVQRKLDLRELVTSVDEALAFAATTRSKPFKKMADEMRDLLADPNIDISFAKLKAAALNADYRRIMKTYHQPKGASVAGSSTVPFETIEDLKKRLGSKFPETLPNLESAIAKFERTSRYGNTAKQYKDEVEAIMRQVFDQHDLGMNIDDDTLELVLNSWFKNTFETGSSGGYVGSRKTTGKISTGHSRLGAAHRMFGLSSDLDGGQLSRHAYEKYGNLLDHNIVESMAYNTARQYGNVEVRFKKDKVVCTWTAGDSLGEQWQPSLVSDPRSCSFDSSSRAPHGTVDIKDLAQFKRDHISGYLELQFHGDLTIDCVESITFPYDLNASGKSNYLSVAKKWKAAGVKVYYVDNGQLYEL